MTQQYTTLPNSATKILQNYCGKTPSFVTDSTNFIKKINHLSINPEEETFASFDVNTLFTSIPVPATLQVIPKFLPAPISPMSARYLQKNSSSFWNSLSPTESSASTGNSINNYRDSHRVTCLPCHCKYLHGILWILRHSHISNINQMVV